MISKVEYAAESCSKYEGPKVNISLISRFVT